MVDDMKFGELLPRVLLVPTAQARMYDAAGLATVLGGAVRFVDWSAG
ncbi:MAG: hypothetical protein H0U74_11415 [Bradymonadaceae bacterium]|nr:hypothetical protein [Lujinxingiaceae bacterium]